MDMIAVEAFGAYISQIFKREIAIAQTVFHTEICYKSDKLLIALLGQNIIVVSSVLGTELKEVTHSG